jgi:hypothetical protein
LYAAWDSKELREAGVNLDIRSSWLDGNAWQPVKTVGKFAAAMSEHPELAASGTGARAVWFDSRSADWRWSLWSASLTTAGSSPPTRLTGAGNATYPSVSGSLLSFTSDRHAARPQRDATEGVFVLAP